MNSAHKNHRRGPAQQARLSITRAQRQRVYARDGYRCVDCGSTCDLTLVHLVPLADQVKPFSRDAELATRCRSCNSARGDAASPVAIQEITITPAGAVVFNKVYGNKTGLGPTITCTGTFPDGSTFVTEAVVVR